MKTILSVSVSNSGWRLRPQNLWVQDEPQNAFYALLAPTVPPAANEAS